MVEYAYLLFPVWLGSMRQNILGFPEKKKKKKKVERLLTPAQS